MGIQGRIISRCFKRGLKKEEKKKRGSVAPVFFPGYFGFYRVGRIEVREPDAMIYPLESSWCKQDQLPFACSEQLGVCLLSWNCCEVEVKERECGEEAGERRLVWGRTRSVSHCLCH